MLGRSRTTVLEDVVAGKRETVRQGMGTSSRDRTALAQVEQVEQVAQVA